MEAVFEYVKPGKPADYELRRTWVAVNAESPADYLADHLRKQGIDPVFEQIYVSPKDEAVDERLRQK